MTDDRASSRDELAALTEEVARLNQQPFLRRRWSVGRDLLMQFLRGLAFGLGYVVGATILVSVLVVMLSKIDFIPIIGDWAAQIAERIKARE